MKKSAYLSLAIGALSLVSCTTLKHTATVAPVESTVVSFTVADLDVKTQKISKTTSWGFNPFKRASIDRIKGNTVAELLLENDADVLVEPEYIIKEGGFLRGGSLTVVGFPGKFTGFHPMTSQEAEVLKTQTEEEVAKDETPVQPQNVATSSQTPKKEVKATKKSSGKTNAKKSGKKGSYGSRHLLMY